MNTKNKPKLLPYSSEASKTVAEEIAGTESYFLVMVGPYKAGKENLLERISKISGKPYRIDLRDVISANEEESFKHIDTLFDELPTEEKTILLENGDVISGEYTGYTYSKQRYATPQERYLLNKISQTQKVVILDLIDASNLTNTMKRQANKAIEFEGPASGLGKLFWRLKQIRLHGHTFDNKRPAF